MKRYWIITIILTLFVSLISVYISGTFFTVIFAQGVGLFYGNYCTFLFHVLALLVVGIFTFGSSYLLYRLSDMIIPMRVKPKSE